MQTKNTMRHIHISYLIYMFILVSGMRLPVLVIKHLYTAVRYRATLVHYVAVSIQCAVRVYLQIEEMLFLTVQGKNNKVKCLRFTCYSYRYTYIIYASLHVNTGRILSISLGLSALCGFCYCAFQWLRS